MTYKIHKPGDVLRLDYPLQTAEAGLYVLLSCGEEFCLTYAGENENGQLCATTHQVRVPAADFCHFQATGLAVDPT